MLVNQNGRKSFTWNIKNAIKKNDKETLCKLIVGVNLNKVVDHKGITLLHLSVRMRKFEMLKFFIENGCDVNARDQTGTTPLSQAVKLCDYLAVDMLLGAKANIALSDNKGTNVLKLILKHHKSNKFSLIELFGNHLKNYGLDTKELVLLIEEAKWPIHYAIYIQNSELIRLMLEAGCDVDSWDEDDDYYTALHIAVLNNDIESIKVLLQHGADTDKVFNERSQSPFSSALNNSKALEAFLDHRDYLLERFNCDGKMESFKTFSYVCYQVIELLLLKYKINLTTKDSHGNTFLHCVVLNDDRNIVNLLSKINFDVNIRDDRGDTLLHAVNRSYHLSCMKMLIDKGADVNAKNNDGDPPLIIGINHAEENKLNMLIKNGAILDEETQNRILTIVREKNIGASIINPVLKRMAILNIEGKKISKRNLTLIKNTSRNDLWDGFSMFLKELHLMKVHIITVHSKVTVFDILSASEKKLLNYARNENIVEQFAKINFPFEYPIYGREMKTRFDFATMKQILIQDAIDMLSKNIEQLKCNLKVIEHIVDYLSFNDLKRLRINSPPAQ